MKQRIIELGGQISRDNGEDYEVLGSNEVLQKVRQILNESNYHDDGCMAGLLGATAAKETISRIFVCDYDEPGYMALA